MTKNNKQENKKDITFANILTVVDHLKKHDWKVGKSLAYLHKKEGKLRPQKDGLFHLKDVEKYAVTFLHRTDGSSGSEVDQYQVEKARAALDISKEQLENLRLKNKVAQGLYVPKDAFERELAQRAIIFKADLETFCRAKAPDVVAVVGGDKDRIPDLIEYLLSESAGWINRYAADREFIVPAPSVESVFENQDEEEEEKDA